MEFVDFCCNDIEAKSSFLLFATAEKSAEKRLLAFSTFYNYYNDNRKSKFKNFDGKSKICEQISKRNLSISVAMI